MGGRSRLTRIVPLALLPGYDPIIVRKDGYVSVSHKGVIPRSLQEVLEEYYFGLDIYLRGNALVPRVQTGDRVSRSR